MKAFICVIGVLTIGGANVAGANIPLTRIERRECLPALNYTAEINYDGCYVDKEDRRTLSRLSTTLRTNNSPQACADICGRAGYSLAGVEYGYECYCGDRISNEKAPSEGSCSTKCPGDSSETCGGSYLINIWNVENVLEDGESSKFPNCNREPLCSNAICDTSLSAKERAEGLISLWTIDEKLANMIDEAAGAPRLGINRYNWWSEGLHGLADRGVEFDAPGSGEWDAATSFPQPILFAAAFDDDLVTRIGDIIGTETRAFNADGRVGLNLYTPNINNFKDPRWGRGQETPGEDPFHAQSYTRAILAGLERKVDGYKKVLVTCKHYAGNDFENFGSVDRHNFDARISPQDLNEFYLAPFRVCAERDAGAFMCSYNRVNGAPSCTNSYLMEDILRGHWGWEKDEHWVSTDCGAITDIWQGHDYVETVGEAASVALKAGTDLNCGGLSDWVAAWEDSLITEDEIDKALVRLWTSLVTLGWFDPAESQSLRQLSWKDVNTEASQKLAYDAAVAGSVLIKNDGHLPLSKGNSVALIGPWVNATVQMQGNYYGPPPYLISPRQAAEDIGLDFTWAVGAEINDPDSTFEEAIRLAKEADEVIFLGGLDNSLEAESHDRQELTWPESQLEIIRELASLGKPVTVVQLGAGQLDDTELLENEAISGILWSGYPGQSGGKAILDLLYGVASPAGRLPVTQYPASYVDEVPPTDMTLRPGQNGTNPGRTHMWYTGDAVVPFGHGLHYTEFEVTLAAEPQWQGEFESSQGDISKVQSLIENTPWMEVINLPAVSISIQIENIGAVKSDYVVLLFLRSDVGPEPRPKQTLVGYTRVKDIEPGVKEVAEVTLQLERFLRVDEDGNRVIYPGKYEVFVDIDEKASLELEWTGESVVVEEFPQSDSSS
jgi:beta-D-xylosidase 4